jgi:mRNA interferase MazF
VVRRGDIWLCDFGQPQGHEPGFRRPAVVLSDDRLNRHGIAVVLPVTRTARGYPTHVELDGALPVVSYVQCELLRAVSTDRVERRVGTVGPVEQGAIDSIIRRLLAV